MIDNSSDRRNYDLICSALKAQPCTSEFIDEYSSLLGNLTDVSDGFRRRNSVDTYLDLCCLEPLVNNLIPYEILSKVLSEMRQVMSNPKLFVRRRCAVGGGFSSGKSSFINSFMLSQATRLATAIKPTTALPCFVMSGSEPVIEGVSPHFGVFSMPSELCKGIDHNLLARLPFNIKKIISYVVVETPLNEELFGHISLIDTPGYDAAAIGTSREDIDVAKKSVGNADCLVWVIGLDANGTISDSDISILEELSFGDDDTRQLYIVANKAELKTPDQREEVLNNFEEILDDYNINYAGISAYSSNDKKEYAYRKQSLKDFFITQNNHLKDYNSQWKDNINKAFGFYITSIMSQTETVKSCLKNINDIELFMVKEDITNGYIDWTLKDLKSYFNENDNRERRINYVVTLRERFMTCVNNFCKSLGIYSTVDSVFCILCGNKLFSGEEICPVCRLHQQKEIKICSQCGEENRPNSEFCFKCGEILRKNKILDL